MNKIVLIDSWKAGKIAFTFEDGQRLSFVFDFGSYTENHSDFEKFDKEQHGERCSWASTTVEVYGADGKAINKYLKKEYGSAPAGGVPVSDIPKILEYIGSLEGKNDGR